MSNKSVAVEKKHREPLFHIVKRPKGAALKGLTLGIVASLAVVGAPLYKNSGAETGAVHDGIRDEAVQADGIRHVVPLFLRGEPPRNRCGP